MSRKSETLVCAHLYARAFAHFLSGRAAHQAGGSRKRLAKSINRVQENTLYKKQHMAPRDLPSYAQLEAAVQELVCPFGSLHTNTIPVLDMPNG